MSKISQSKHDEFFRAAMANVNVAREFCTYYLPSKVLKAIDLNSLALCAQSYVDETLKISQSDILYKVKMAKKEAYLFFLNEHQSTPDRLMPFRCLKYQVNIWADHLKQHPHKKLPLIITTVFYNGKKPYTYDTDFRSLLDASSDLIEEVWNKPFKLIDISQISDETLREQKWLGVMGFFMKHIFARDFLPLLKLVMAQLKGLETEHSGREYVVNVLNYLLSTATLSSPEEFVNIVKEGLSDKTGEKIMTAVEYWIQKGVKQGIEQGIKQGIEQGTVEGEKLLLQKLIAKRFGNLSSAYQEMINQASPNDLIVWAEKLLDVKTLEEVFNNN